MCRGPCQKVGLSLGGLGDTQPVVDVVIVRIFDEREGPDSGALHVMRRVVTDVTTKSPLVGDLFVQADRISPGVNPDVQSCGPHKRLCYGKDFNHNSAQH